MNRVYIYESHNCNDIYLSDRELSQEELYCEYCGDSDRLLEVCDTESARDEALTRLLKDRDLLPCDDYEELISRYTDRENSDE